MNVMSAPDDQPGRPGRTMVSVHGVLVQIFETGVLIVGESGSGKSECALDLISRGHQLVADDVVNIELEDGRLTGAAPGNLFGLLEVRGIGICDVRRMYGSDRALQKWTIELCIDIRDRLAADEITRAGSEQLWYELLAVKLPRYVFAADRPNLPLLIQTAARVFTVNGISHVPHVD